MKIAYRRMSGAVGISNMETGTRGMWLEKRRSLVGWLKERGHQVTYVSRMTKFSPQISKEFKPEYDLVMIEFGSRNTVFYGPDLDETLRIVSEHSGPIIFLCDDPDLPFIWNRAGASDLKKFSVWSNCLHPREDSTLPEGMPAHDFPFSSLQPAMDGVYADPGKHLVYIGRPGGREKVFKSVLSIPDFPLKIHAKQKEWDGWGVTCLPAPSQVDRPLFYRAAMGCLAIADKKHKRLGWRTGRAYHAALSGCPVIAEEDHPALQGFQTFRDPEELLRITTLWQDPRMRAAAVERQKTALADDRIQAERTAKEFGL